jgi:hypothetical protein
MALGDNELFASRSFAGRPRMVVERNKVGTIGTIAAAPELVVGTPLAWSSSTLKWTVYTQPSDAAIYTITDQAGATDGGSFMLFIDGVGVYLAWNVLIAAAQTAINNALAAAGKDYTVVVTCTEVGLGVSGAVMTLTFSENAGAPVLQLDGTGLSDGGVAEPGNLVLAASDAGTALNGTNEIAGFLAHHDVATSAADDVQAVIMLAGEIHADDVNTTAIRALCGGSPSAAEMTAALKKAALRLKDIHIRGLAAVEGS